MKHLLLYLLLFLSFRHAGATTFSIAPGNDINTVINRSAAGDTILFLPGTHATRGIVVDHPLFLIGKGNATLDGQGKYEIITVRSDNVIIEGLHLFHSGYSSINDLAGIHIYNARNVLVRNNSFTNNYFAIYLQHVSHSVIMNNKLESDAANEIESGNGIHCWKSDSLVIAGNSITGHRDGIYFEFVTASNIINNKSFGNIRYGLHFMFSHNDLYVNNTFSNNGAGVAIMYTKHVRMYKNKFINNWGNAAYGILMKDISDSHAEGNEFNRNTAAIYMEGSSRIMITRNRFTNNGYAMKIQASCDNNNIVNNNFQGNSFDVATNGSLVLNYFTNNFWDKYEGYDLDRDGKGDVPYRPTSLFTILVERNASAMMLLRSPITSLVEKAEKILPVFTPESMKDNAPLMKPLPL
ncbi:nitrous oxide reductase family maturation protein NosD [Flavihumibacter rivuli]|uniref:nitrous oxide reductase family maturation protein NosD n=1 Tax=Flavihumibacter rivuli TaxID=2838156 RepID=UPI001BDECACE|nr:nitrous oxide reductase family maturation protein NosD [Flavihumibacter rivuli]ULQ56799.1 nitrous oxide reductase family maturation protein NosD [Flavihumibacter rivuli]